MERRRRIARVLIGRKGGRKEGRKERRKREERRWPSSTRCRRGRERRKQRGREQFTETHPLGS